MKNAGWTLGVEVWENNNAGVLAQCRRGSNWFGWSHHTNVGAVSATLRGNGGATLDFGNCFHLEGEVTVYLNDKVVAKAEKNTPSKKESFNFNDGEILELRDEGDSSIISINDISFSCGYKR